LTAGELGARRPTEQEAAEAPWLAFAVAKARRLAGESARPTTELGPGAVLQAEIAIDAGETGRATNLLTALLERFPAQTRARLTLAEARAANALPPAAAEASALPVGPDERILAVRAALARNGAAGIGNILRGMGPQQVNADPDLGWFAALSRIQQRRAGVRLAERYLAPGARAPSPMGAYVLGLLARWGGRRHLAAYWLARARDGHGDACTASMLYVATEGDLGRKPLPGAIAADCRR